MTDDVTAGKVCGASAAMVALAAIVVAGAAGARGPLTPEQARGKQIYSTGTSPRGRLLEATILGDIVLPADQHACVQCHRRDGRGGLEGGVEVPDIRWSQLFSPHGRMTLGGTVRPPYDEAALDRAIRDGVDPSDRELYGMMPRFNLEADDLADLRAYLRVLGNEAAPGAASDRVRIGALLPLDGPAGARGHQIAGLLGRFFDEVNGAGGVHGRTVELVVRDAGATPEAALAAARSMIEGDDEPVFAFVANSGAGADRRPLGWLARERVPVVGPLTLARGAPKRGTVFYLLAGLEDHGRALARFLRRDDPPGRIAVVRAAGSAGQALARAFSDEAAALGLELVAAIDWDESDPESVVGSLREAGADRVMLAGSAAVGRTLLTVGASGGWRPQLAVSRVLAGDLSAVATAEVVSAGPGVAASEGSAGTRLLERLLAEASRAHPPEVGLRPGDRMMVTAAFAAAEVLVEILRRAGRDLDREAFVEQLRDLRDFETGVTPALAFGPNRRVGARGALVLRHAAGGAVHSGTWVAVE